MSHSNFQDKVIFITGAASGFGKILAEELSAAGAKLVLGDIDSMGLNTVSESLREKGADLVAQTCDVTDESAVANLVSAAVDTYGRLDIAINNAGIATGVGALIDVEEKDMDLNFAVNAKSVLFGMKYQIRQMLEQGQGVILNVSSMAGVSGAPKNAAYSASKHAVIGLTKTAAVEYGRKNIRVNAICPFFTPTPMVTNGDPSGEKQAFVAQGSPMKRLGTPEEIVAAMLAVISPLNSYMNGQAIHVDGGVSA